jgi:hypothetical protein
VDLIDTPRASDLSVAYFQAVRHRSFYFRQRKHAYLRFELGFCGGGYANPYPANQIDQTTTRPYIEHACGVAYVNRPMSMPPLMCSSYQSTKRRDRNSKLLTYLLTSVRW